MNNFLKTSDFSRAELEEIIESAIKIKSGEIAEKSLAENRSRSFFLIRVCGHALRCRSGFTNSAEMP